jgi:hypothetical protein
MKRPIDRITIVGDAGEWELFERVEITHDLSSPSVATIALGDDGAYSQMLSTMRPGSKWSLWIGNALQLAGRVEVFDWPADESGIKVGLTIKTKLSDAQYASASTSTRVYDTSIEDFIVQLFAQIGYKREDFIFEGSTRVDLMSGKKSKVSKASTTLEPIDAKAAKVSPGETIFEAASRHLERHGLLLLDHPDGRIQIYRPDLKADPHYRFFLRRSGPETQANNILRARPSLDWSESPSEVVVYGVTWGAELEKAPIFAKVTNDEVQARFSETGMFARRVIQVQNQLRTAEQARNKARREMSNLRRRQDAWTIDTDGAGYFDGEKEVQFCPGTIINVDVEGTQDADYFCHHVRIVSDENGTVSSLEMTRADLIDFGAAA